MSLTERRVPRLAAVPEQAPLAQRHSRAIQADLDALAAEVRSAEAELERLSSRRNEVLLSDNDDAAEQHDAAMRKQRRIIERANLRGPRLAEQLQEAVEREDDERRAKQKDEATAQVQALMLVIEKNYREPARKIAAFLQRWLDVAAAANAAGISGPGEAERFQPARVLQPERTQTYECFVDEQGNDTSEEFPILPYGAGRDRTKPRRKVTRTHVVQAANVASAFHHPDPVGLVRLPGIVHGDEHLWPPAAQNSAR